MIFSSRGDTSERRPGRRLAAILDTEEKPDSELVSLCHPHQTQRCGSLFTAPLSGRPRKIKPALSFSATHNCKRLSTCPSPGYDESKPRFCFFVASPVVQKQVVPHVHRLPDLQALELAAGPQHVHRSQRRHPPAAAAERVGGRPVERVEERRRHGALHGVLSVERAA